MQPASPKSYSFVIVASAHRRLRLSTRFINAILDTTQACHIYNILLKIQGSLHITRIVTIADRIFMFFRCLVRTLAWGAMSRQDDLTVESLVIPPLGNKKTQIMGAFESRE